MHGGGRKPRKPTKKDKRNLIRLKEESEAIKFSIIRDAKNIFEH